MEIELKYGVPDGETCDILWEDSGIQAMEEKGSRDTEEHQASYYDTADLDLLARDIAFRIRREGNRTVATLKWNGKTVGALHTREELNINLGDVPVPETPDPQVFSPSEIGGELLSIIGGKPLREFISVHVSRRRVRVDTNQAIVELAIDTGQVHTAAGSCPVCELELELYSGKEEELLRLGEQLSTQYGLAPEPRSKFARGLSLLGLCNTKHIEGEE